MPDFANDENWIVVYDQLTIGSIIDAFTYQPIPPILLPNPLEYAFLRVTANNQNARIYWRLGAWIDFLVDDDFPQVEVERILAPVNKPKIIYKPEILETYRLKATIPYYFDEISLRIEGYIEPEIRQAIRINCGGGAVGNWLADIYFQGGQTFVYSSLGIVNPTPPIGVSDPIFGDERSAASFSYSIPNLSGNYTLKLYFNESGVNSVGARVFNVSANGSTILSSFDIFAQIGKDRVLVKEFAVTVNGTLNLAFQSTVNNAQINAIEIIPI